MACEVEFSIDAEQETHHGETNGFCAGGGAGQASGSNARAGEAYAVEARIVARSGGAGAVCGQEFSALLPQWLAAAYFADEGCGAVRGDVLCDAQVQSGLQLLHAKGAGRF